MPVPSSYNDITTDSGVRKISIQIFGFFLHFKVRDFLGWAWYDHHFYSPPGWKTKRVVLRFSSSIIPNTRKALISPAYIKSFCNDNLDGTQPKYTYTPQPLERLHSIVISHRFGSVHYTAVVFLNGVEVLIQNGNNHPPNLIDPIIYFVQSLYLMVNGDICRWWSYFSTITFNDTLS